MPVVVSGDPCQLGRVAFCTSEAYPEDTYPVEPCWRSETWLAMDLRTFYLIKLHRCSGGDVEYLGMLAEIRGNSRSDGRADFSPTSMKVLEAIRDREGGDQPPR